MASIRAVLERLARRAAGDPPDEALRAIAGLRRELERVEALQAERALEAGASWSQIAEALGVSKQAAHQRLAELVQGGEPASAAKPQGKVVVTGDAREAVRLAREEAARLRAPSVGTEHLLLGILRCKDSAPARALGALGLSLESARAAIQPTLVDLQVTEQASLPRSGPDGRPQDVRARARGARAVAARDDRARRGLHPRRARAARTASRPAQRRRPDPR